MEGRENIAFKTNLLKKLPLCKNEENIFVECEIFVNFVCDNVEGIKKSNVSRHLKVNTVLLEKRECVPIHSLLHLVFRRMPTKLVSCHYNKGKDRNDGSYWLTLCIASIWGCNTAIHIENLNFNNF
jgi:hypothetical protein